MPTSYSLKLKLSRFSFVKPARVSAMTTIPSSVILALQNSKVIWLSFGHEEKLLHKGINP